MILKTLILLREIRSTRIGVVQNPEAYDSTSNLELDKPGTVYALKLTGAGYSSAAFTADARFTQTVGVGSTAIGRVVSYDSTTDVFEILARRSLVGFNTDGSQNTDPTYGFNLLRFTSTPWPEDQ